MQNYNRMYSYTQDYLSKIYDYYSKHAIAFATTYYNIDKETTVWDDEDLLGGSYERIGSLSGMKWDKYLTLPGYFVDELNTTPFDGSDIGLIKDSTFSMVIPSSYGITPYAGDIVKIDKSYLNTVDNHPLYIVAGTEKSVNADKTFWKLKLDVMQSISVDALELQVDGNFMFYEYDKNIHNLNDAATLTRMLIKSEKIKSELDAVYDKNCGLYHK